MKFKISKLRNDIKGKIIVYGVGCWAQEFYQKLCDVSMENCVNSFVVTNKVNKEVLYNKPVYMINELEKHYKGEAILVAVSEQYRKEIEDELKKYTFTPIYFLSDYVYNPKNVWNLYKEKNQSDYMDAIKEWHLDYMESQEEVPNMIDLCCREGKKRNTQIVFIIGMEMSMPRNVKIMKALKKKGYDIKVLLFSSAEGTIVKEELEAYQIKVDKVQYIEELMRKMLQYKSSIYYLEPEWGNFDWIAVLIRQKQLFGKIVVTLYDVFNDGLVFATQEQKAMEQYILENADGIVWRWDAKESLEKQGMRFTGVSLQFWDYCNGEFNNTDVVKDNQKRLDLCYVCGHPSIVFHEQKELEKGYAVVAKMQDILEKLENKNCRFHAFMMGLDETAMNKCKELEKKYEFFKVYFGYSHAKMIESIKNFDYGCQIFTGGTPVPDDVSVDGRYYGAIFRDGSCNKQFDYIDAGLPVIATQPTKLCDYLEKKGVLVKMSLDTLDIQYLSENRNYYKEKVLENRYELTVDYQINRMINFFEEISMK